MVGGLAVVEALVDGVTEVAGETGDFTVASGLVHSFLGFTIDDLRLTRGLEMIWACYDRTDDPPVRQEARRDQAEGRRAGSFHNRSVCVSHIIKRRF
jgi:hypothetical protein